MFKLDIKKMDKKTLSLMFDGFKISLITLIFSSYILLLYKLNPISHTLFKAGFLLFKAGLMFAISFFICAFVIEKLKNNII